MIELLAGVPGMLKSLRDRLTATRAANLDKVDVNTSSRAPASTALSNQVWTDARAAKLDLPSSPLGRSTTGLSAAGTGYTGSNGSQGIHAVNMDALLNLSHYGATWDVVLNLTGSGVIMFLALYNNSGALGEIKVELDGVTIYTGSVNTTAGSVNAVIGGVFPTWDNNSVVPWMVPTYVDVPFSSSLKVSLKGTALGLIKYRSTAAQ